MPSATCRVACTKPRLLLDRIAEEAGDDAAIVFVGDLVNRGPDSLAALRRVLALCEASGGRVEALLGNHDLHLLAVACGAQQRLEIATPSTRSSPRPTATR